MRSFRSARLLPLLALLFLVGCRTYGGYESEEKIYANLQDAVNQFEEDLDRAKADLASLEEAAADNEALEGFAERFAEEIDRHERTLNEHRDVMAGLSASSSYRNLHRSYGAITTDARLINKIYDRTIQRVAETVQGGEFGPTVTTTKSNYYVEPVDSYQVRNQGRMTMDEALGQ